jgi:tetratricopeptide (TPR) repeat protein
MILRRHGENRQAGPLIDRLADYTEFSPSLDDAVRRMRDFIPLERKHQAEAADRLERALLAGQIKAPNQGTARYLLGELNRRLGRDRQAVAWFDKVLASPELPADLKTWAGQQRAGCLAEDQR